MPPKPLDLQVLASEKSEQTPLGVQISERRKMPKGGHATSDDSESFIRHDTYFFKDGNVTFLVGGALYCVHRYFFSRDSVYFSTRLSQLDIRDHEALPTIISIGNIERNDFEALLSVLYPVNFETYELSYEQWKSVLHLSTLWGFASLRKLALKSIKPPTPHDQLVLARTYSVDQWVLPALTALCSRTLPLRLDEARHMKMEDVILVATIREEIRGGALRVDEADIPSHIETALTGKPNHPTGNDTYWYCPMSGTTGLESNSTMASGVNLNVEVEDAKTTGVVLPSGPQQRSAKECGTNTSDVECSPNEVPADSPDARQGVEQQHVKGTPQVLLEEVVAMPAVQTRETQRSEETPQEAAAWPLALAQATFAMGAIAQKPEVLLRPIRGLPGQTEGPMKDKLAPEAMAKAEAVEEQTKAKAEDKTIKAESVGLHAMQAKEQIAEQRAMDNATRVGASASSSTSPARSPSGNWFSKIFQAASVPVITSEEESALLPKSTIPRTSDIFPNGKNTSPNTFGPLPSDSSPGAPVQRLSDTSLTPHGPHSMHPVNSITAIPLSASVMHSSPTIVSHEREPVNDKQDGHTGEGTGDQTQNTTAALPAKDLMEPAAPQLGHSSLASAAANVTSTTSMSSSGTLADNAQASMSEDDWGSCEPRLTKAQRKRMRDKAKKRAQMGEKNKSRPLSGETPNKVDNLAVQEHKPVANSLPCRCSVCRRSGVSLASQLE